MTHRAAQEAAKDISSSLVAGEYSIGGQENQGASMVGDHPQRYVMFCIVSISCVRHGRKTINDGAEQVSIEDRFFTLQDHRQALQPQSGIDVLPGQRRARSVEILVVLHEDEVPDLQKAFALTARFTVSSPTAVLDAAIIVDLGVGATGTRGSWRPPPVFFQSHNSFVGETGHLAPVEGSFVIVGVDCRMQTPGRQFVHPRQ